VRSALQQLHLAARVRERIAEALRVRGIVDALDDLLVVHAPVLARLEDAHLVVADVEDAGEALAHAHRPRERHRRHAQDLLDLVQHRERLLALAVQLVDEGDDGRIARPADFQQRMVCASTPFTESITIKRRVHRRQHAVGVFREVLVARRVEQVDDVAAELDLHDGARDRDAALLLDLHPVAGGVAGGLSRLHAARDVDGPREEEELLGEGGLPGVRVRDDREGAAARALARDGGIGAHGGDIFSCPRPAAPKPTFPRSS
jgi:hypothetical protein